MIDLFFPPSCLACARVLEARDFFCPDCRAELAALYTPCCPRCAEPSHSEEALCMRCRRYPPPFLRAHAPFAHEGPIARAIHQFKYEDHPELAAGLAALLCSEAAFFLREAPMTVCAIPLHPRRFQERRYDQSQLLAGELAKRTRRICLVGALERRRETKRQVGLNEADRERNVAGAFAAQAVVEGQRVLLIDDVFTTGATARAAASALLSAGAVDVQVLTLARAYTGA